MVTAVAGSNIALIKYWGQPNQDLHKLRIPDNESISITLNTVETRTTVEIHEETHDTVLYEGKPVSPGFQDRVIKHSRLLAQKMNEAETFFRIDTQNTFPMGAGIASSASGFAALTHAIIATLGKEIDKHELSILARQGSGSAARSIYGGYVGLTSGTRSEDSYAYLIASEDHWSLIDLIAVVSSSHKSVGSSKGHQLVETTPVHNARMTTFPNTIYEVKKAIDKQDFETVAGYAERDALLMHAAMMTSQPALLYWQPGTIEIIHLVQNLRNRGVPCFFTIDAGPNVHVITNKEGRNEVRAELELLGLVQQIFEATPGRGSRIL
ncbi:MAG: diphosphomevalonate decarboxylase [Candidatus Kariarchaeaceae archaeon]